MGRIPLPRKTGGPHESGRYERHAAREEQQSLASPAPAFRVGDRVIDPSGRRGEVTEILDSGPYRHAAYGVRYDDGRVEAWPEEALIPFR